MNGRIAEIFAVLALFAYSMAFTAPYAVPKLIVLSIGAVVLTLGVALGSEIKDPIPAFLVWGVVFLCALFAKDQWLAIAGRYNSYALGILGISLALVYYLASDGENRILPLIGGVLGLHAFAQYAGFDAAYTSKIDGNRAISTIGSPVDLGLVLAMLFPLAWAKSKVYALAVFLGVLSTGSRGALIASLAGLGAMKWSR